MGPVHCRCSINVSFILFIENKGHLELENQESEAGAGAHLEPRVGGRGSVCTAMEGVPWSDLPL